uniref:Uncharacterized protein n=1 Tax=Populus trichocarpa TaxID=3694 RepID=A0A2K1R566_POPTR
MLEGLGLEKEVFSGRRELLRVCGHSRVLAAVGGRFCGAASPLLLVAGRGSVDGAAGSVGVSLRSAFPRPREAAAGEARAREEQMVCGGLREERGVGCWSAAGEGKMRRKKGQRARESEGEDLWRGEPVKDGCWPRKRKRDGRGGREKMLKISGEGQRRLLSFFENEQYQRRLNEENQ